MMVNKIALISYAIGLGVGSGATYILVKNHYRKVADEEIQSVKDSLNKKIDELLEQSVHNSYENYPFEPDAPEEVDEGGMASNRSKHKEDYTKFYNGGGEVEGILNSLAENQHPEDDAPKERNKKVAKGPKLIKGEEYDAYPEYRKITVYYYIDDNVIADENDGLELEDVDGHRLGSYNSLIGNCISKYGFDKNDETIIYVRNESIKTDFEIMKDFGSYRDATAE